MARFHCRGCGQLLDMPDDVQTPVVICPRCAEPIAIRDDPRPVEIPPRPEQSEAITSERPPDRQDVMAHRTNYRAPHDRSPAPEWAQQPLRIFVRVILWVVVPAGLATVPFAE